MGIVDVRSCEGIEEGGEVVAVSALAETQMWRAGALDRERVVALASSVMSFPPIVVNRRDMSVVDGAHRVAAVRNLGLRTVPVEWIDGTCAEAFVEFAARNGRSGAPLTMGDRRLGALRVVGDHPEWSDRRIAHTCGVPPKLVARLRTQCATKTTSRGHEKRVGRDGRARPLQRGVIRVDIAKALRDSPLASLRTIAAELGVSPESVRMVRKGLSVAGGEMVAIERPAVTRLEHVEPSPWSADNGFGSTEQGVAFIDWFEATSIADCCGRADHVPLSRVYEVADEARRRAHFWTEFADTLERRSRSRR